MTSVFFTECASSPKWSEPALTQLVSCMPQLQSLRLMYEMSEEQCDSFREKLLCSKATRVKSAISNGCGSGVLQQEEDCPASQPSTAAAADWMLRVCRNRETVWGWGCGDIERLFHSDMC